MKNYLFKEKGIDLIMAGANKKNKASIGLFRKCGFKIDCDRTTNHNYLLAIQKNE